LNYYSRGGFVVGDEELEVAAELQASAEETRSLDFSERLGIVALAFSA
jgi:hypothetical protein